MMNSYFQVIACESKQSHGEIPPPNLIGSLPGWQVPRSYGINYAHVVNSPVVWDYNTEKHLKMPFSLCISGV